MEVIGIISGKEEYICKVSHRELEKFLDLYYNKLEGLKVGSIVDLGKGHDFCRDTINALKKTEEFICANKSVIDSIITGISIMEAASKEAAP